MAVAPQQHLCFGVGQFADVSDVTHVPGSDRCQKLVHLGSPLLAWKSRPVRRIIPAAPAATLDSALPVASRCFVRIGISAK